MKYLVILLLLCTGCYTPITSLDGHIPKQQVEEFPTVDSVLVHYLTPEAYQTVRDIPTVNGFTPSAYAAGTSLWSSMASWVSGSGTGRKVIFSKKSLWRDGYSCIIHEYIHHLDDMTRDDPENHQWIDLDVFLQAYKMLSEDHKYKGIQTWCESRANDFVTNVFGIGRASEHVAYIGMFLSERTLSGRPKGAPEYLKAVFGRIFSATYQKTSIYINMRGEKYLVSASPDKIEMIRIE